MNIVDYSGPNNKQYVNLSQLPAPQELIRLSDNSMYIVTSDPPVWTPHLSRYEVEINVKPYEKQ